MHNESKRMCKLELFGRFVDPDGNVVESEIKVDDAALPMNEMDLTTEEGFLTGFDVLEKSLIKGRDALCVSLAEGYVEAAQKKTKQKD